MSSPSKSAAERAMEAKPPVRRIFGKVTYMATEDVGFTPDPVNRYEPFDRAKHGTQKPRVKINIEVEAYKRAGTWVAKQEYIDNNKKWYGITLPSMQKTNLHLTTIEGQWVEIEFRQTGRSWEDRTTGETRFEETFYFIRKFKDQSECEGAYTDSMGWAGDEAPSASDGDGGSASTGQASAASSGIDPNLQRAVQVMWSAVGQDDKKFIASVSINPMIMSAFVTADAALAFVKGDATTAELPAAAAGTSTDGDDDIPF